MMFNAFHIKRDQNIMGGTQDVLPSSSCPTIGVSYPPLLQCSITQHFLHSPHLSIPSLDYSSHVSSLVPPHHRIRIPYLESKIKNIVDIACRLCM